MHVAALQQAIYSGEPLPGSLPPLMSGVSLSLGNFQMTVGDTPVQIVATMVSQTGLPIPLPVGAAFTWDSDNPSFATVDTDGIVTPVAAGVAVITASYGGLEASLSVDVQAIVTPAVVDHIAISPATQQDMVDGATGALFEATPQAADNSEIPRTMVWELETDDGTVTVDDAVGPTYKHALVNPTAPGTDRVRAGCDEGGNMVWSAWVDLVVTANISGDPNKPVAQATLILDHAFDALPPATGVSADGFTKLAGSFLNLSIMADPNSPNGLGTFIRCFHSPNTNGGGSSWDIGWNLRNAPHSLSLAAMHHTYAHVAHRVSKFWIIPVPVGYKQIFVQQSTGTNSFLNTCSRGLTHSLDLNKQSPSPAFLATTSMNLFPANRDRWLHEEIIIYGNDTPGVADGLFQVFVDGVDKTNGGKPLELGGNGIDRWRMTATQGGGSNPPYGVKGVGALNKFTRSDGIPGTVGADNRTFTRSDGGTFDLSSSSSNHKNRYWWFVRADGTVIDLSSVIQNVTATTLQAPTGIDISGAVAVYSGDEVSDAAAIGTELWFRKSVINRLVEVYRGSANKGTVSGTPYIGTADAAAFTLSSGTFIEAGIEETSWAFKKADGTVVGPILVPAANIVGGVLTIPVGTYFGGTLAGCIEAYPLGYPLIGKAAITGVSTTTVQNDTIEVTGIDLTGADWAFGFMHVDQTQPMYQDYAFVRIYR